MKKFITTMLVMLMCIGMISIVKPTEVFAASSGTYGTCAWDIDDNGVLTIHAGTLKSNTSTSSSSGPWYDRRSEIKKIIIEPGVIAGEGMNYLFYNLINCTEIDLSGLNTNDVTSMRGLFQNCSSLTSLNLLSLNTSKVTTMLDMFNGCRGLTNLDLSNFNTSAVTSMDGMFQSCSGLTNLDLSHFDTSKVTTMYSMFNSCSGLTNLDLSHFNTANVTTFRNMFTNASSLKKVIFGENISFTGKNITNASYKLVLPTPPASSGGISYTRKWIREDKTYGPFTPAEFRDNYISEMAGTWVWDGIVDGGTVIFDSNGGVITGTDRQTVYSDSPSVMLPDDTQVKRSHYILKGWNTAADGTGTHYDAGASYSVPIQSDPTTLYAEWEYTTMRGYIVEHYQQSTTDATVYTKSGEESFTAEAGTEVTPEVKTYEGFIAPEPQTVTVADDDSTVVQYYYDRMSYSILFDGNGATSGLMNAQKMFIDISNDIARNIFSKVGSIFIGWALDPSSDVAYMNMQQVLNLASENGETVTLYAKWMDNENSTVTEDGEFTVYAKAGQTIVIPDLPAGMTYEIEEVDIPSGWTKTEEENVTGTIRPNITSNSKITNEYSADGSIQLVAHKLLNGGELQEGDYSFQLLLNGEVIDTKENGAVDTSKKVDIIDPDTFDVTGEQDNPWYGTAPVEFDDLQYTLADVGKTYVYTIREIAGSDPKINYDSHEETVTVSVEDAGHGILRVTATYDADGALFTNGVEAGNLEIAKHIEGETDSVADTIFTFTINLKDKDGEPLAGSYNAKVSSSDDTITVSDGGTVQLKGGESVTITGLPDGVTYSIIESEVSGWTLTDDSNAGGTIHGSETAHAEFTNSYTEVYDAEGVVELTAKKKVTGGIIEEDDHFVFQLVDERGSVLQEKETDQTGVAESMITFDPIGLTLDDVGEHTYIVREVVGADEHIEYDESYYEVRLNVSDNGNGTLNVTQEYYKDDEPVTEMEFVNKKPVYHDLTVTKTVSGSMGDKSEAFAFVLAVDGVSEYHRNDDIKVTFDRGDGEPEVVTVHYRDLRSYKFNLAHGDTMTVEGLAEDVQYTVTETKANKNGYNTTAQADLGNVDNAVVTGTLTDDESISYRNTKDVAVPTGGIDLGSPQSIFMFGMSLLIFMFFWTWKKKNERNMLI